MRVREHLRDALHGVRDPRRDLRPMSSVLHREAEADRHRRPRRAVSAALQDRRVEGGLALEARLAAALARAADVERELANPATARDPKKLKALGREHARLQRVMAFAARLARAADELEQARELARSPETELAELARADLERLTPEIARLRAELDALLLPPDPLDDRDTILEIRAGTGGDEAALFAAELLRMYTRF